MESYDQPSPESYKKMRGEDRLSDLPEPLLHHIFSFLPTKEVVRSTYLLSKTWTHFWASFPHLFFNISGSTNDFDDVGFLWSPVYVDKFLICRGTSGPDLQKLCLRWLECDNGREVKDWIAMALDRNVRELDIFLGLDGITWTIPAKVFKEASSVKAIRLESCSFCYRFLVPRPMLLAPNLRTLELIKVKLPKGDSKGELVLGCPVLETLIMNKCLYRHLKVLNLSVNRLKKLEIDNSGYMRDPYGCFEMRGLLDRLGDCKLELHTPNLSTFVYKGVMYGDFSLGKLAALIDVDLFLCESFLEGLSCLGRSAKVNNSRYVKLLKGLNGARTLALRKIVNLTQHLSEIHSDVPDILEELLTSYANLKKLELQASSYCGPCHAWLASLLCQCSSIEALVLNAIPFRPSKEYELALPFCPLNRLKYIVVRGVEGDDNELELLRFLFKSAVSLERMAITGGGSKNSKIKTGDLLNFQDKLKTLSQDFPNVEVSFQIL